MSKLKRPPQAVAVDGKGEIFLYGEIGWEVSSLQFAQDLARLGVLDELTVRIDSVGGNVFQATAIYATLLASPARVIGQVDGVCASAAAFILQAADERRMGEASQFMIHEASGGIWGKASEIEDYLTLLRNTDEIIRQMFCRRSGLSYEQLAELLSRDTWLTASEAKELGMVDEVIAATRARPAQTTSATAARPAGRITADDLQAARNAYTTLAAIAVGTGDHVVTTQTKPTVPAAQAAIPIQNPLPDSLTQSAAPNAAAVAPAPAATPAAAIQPAAPAVVPAPAAILPVPAAVPARDPKESAEIVRLCNKCGVAAKAAEYLETGTPLDQVRAALLDLQIASRPVSTQVGDPDPKPAKETPAVRFGKEFDAAADVHAKFGVTRDQYVASRCRDEGLDPPAKA